MSCYSNTWQPRKLLCRGFRLCSPSCLRTPGVIVLDRDSWTRAHDTIPSAFLWSVKGFYLYLLSVCQSVVFWDWWKNLTYLHGMILWYLLKCMQNTLPIKIYFLLPCQKEHLRIPAAVSSFLSFFIHFCLLNPKEKKIIAVGDFYSPASPIHDSSLTTMLAPGHLRE